MGIDENFRIEYGEIVKKMAEQAEKDKDVFLPNPEPEGPVNYVLICMEPSLGRWARSREEAAAKVKKGFRNFLPSDETSILHFSIRRYLCGPSERYHITDLSKGAMHVGRASEKRIDRWNRWYPLLQDEIKLVGPNARIIAVGRQVSRFLLNRGDFGRLFDVTHYSSLAGAARSAGIRRHEAEFESFKDSVSKEDLTATAQHFLASARVPQEIRKETLEQLEKFQLTYSRQKLMFIYKLAFEKIRSD
jgi:hypothetical protein